MENITWSAIISGIALIAAILSPIFTTILTNRHEDKVWKRKNFFERRSQVIASYIRNTGKLLKYQEYHDLSSYGESYGEIFMYAPQNSWPFIIKIDTCVRNLPITDDSVQREFDVLCNLLTNTLKEDVKPKKRKKHAE